MEVPPQGLQGGLFMDWRVFSEDPEGGLHGTGCQLGPSCLGAPCGI